MYSKHFLKHIILVIVLSQMLFSSSSIKKIWVPIGVGDILTFVPIIIPTSDVIVPKITLNGQNPITLTVGDTYIEAGATAKDNLDGNVNVTITGSVDSHTIGTYTLSYTAKDSAGNRAIKRRIIIVKQREDGHYIYGGKSDNSGEGSYYPYDDEDAKRGLKFNADKAFLLHSVKVYNQVGEASTRIFSLFDSSGNKIASKKVIVPEGESRLVLDFKIPEGSGYTLMADTHKGLYRNTNVNGYPYAIGDVGSIISANESSTDYYYFFYDWKVFEGDRNSSGILSLSDYDKMGLSGYGILSKPSEPSADNKIPYIPDLTNLNAYNNIIYIKPNVGIGIGEGTKLSPRSIYDIFPSTKYEAKKQILENTIIVALPGEYIIKKNLFFPKTVKNVIFVSQSKHQAKLIMAHQPLNEDDNSLKSDNILLYRNDEGQWKGQRENALFIKNISRDIVMQIQKFSVIGFESYPAELDSNGNVVSDNNGKIVPQNFLQPYKDEELNWKENPNDTKVFKKWDNLTKNTLLKALKHSRGFLRVPDWNNVNNISEKIYISDMKFHHYEGVLFSSQNSLQWTIDKSLFYHSNGSYLWYMNGWQNSVVNSVMYDCDGNVLSMRGGNASENDKKWTALVAYNTFGATDSKRFRNHDRNQHIGIYAEKNKSRSGEVIIINNISVGDQKQYYTYENGLASDYPEKNENIFLLGININIGNSITLTVKNNVTDKEKLNTDDSIKDNIYNVKDILFKRVDKDSNGLRDYSISSDNSNIKNKAIVENWKPNVDTNGEARDNKPDIGAFEIK